MKKATLKKQIRNVLILALATGLMASAAHAAGIVRVIRIIPVILPVPVINPVVSR